MQEDIQRLIQNQADFIVSQQLPSGAIPWYRGGITDPWDHVECAMALDFSGRFSEASLAYKWMRNIQNPDGSWYFSYLDDKPQDLTKDTNFSTYIATGMWFHYLATRDPDFLRYMWPTVEKGINFALSLQQPSGEIYWGLSENNEVWPGAILTASSSTWFSIKCGIKIAKKLGLDKTDWEKASQKLAKAIKEQPERFDRLGEDKSGHAMTWYYPILVGLLEGNQARERISGGWQDFMIDRWGCKCFVDRQSVCVAETFELILALTKLGDKDKAKMVLDWVLQFRDNDGVFYREVYWPRREIRRAELEPQAQEKNTWTSAAAILA
ncbi:MAG TPA: prenyltransferase, partial [Chloroflexi bacterium]|nr:prenyltransferase [Chloroflexota bacterium]